MGTAHPIQVLFQAAAHGVFIAAPVDVIFLAGFHPLVQRPPVVELRKADGQHCVEAAGKGFAGEILRQGKALGNGEEEIKKMAKYIEPD